MSTSFSLISWSASRPSLHLTHIPTCSLSHNAAELSICPSSSHNSLSHLSPIGGEVEGLGEGRLGLPVMRPEDDHLRDANLPPIDVPFGSVSTSNLVKDLFPEGLPKITIQKVPHFLSICNNTKKGSVEKDTRNTLRTYTCVGPGMLNVGMNLKGNGTITI